jgi:opacity protein-like surface antigen
MKTILLLSLALAIPAFGGTSSKAVIAPAPAPDPCLFTWFAGGSVGYLTELEEPMYNLHVGTDTCWNIGGWNVALFAEIGYTEKSEDWSSGNYDDDYPGNGSRTMDYDDYDNFEDGGNVSLGDVENILSDIADYGKFGSTGYDLDILPITLNLKLERQLSGGLNAYFGGGLGMARVDFSADVGSFGDFSDDDWVFTAQIFAGLSYNVTQNFEVYGGARWIYLDDADLSDSDLSVGLDLEDDWLLELGLRYNF